MNPTSGQPSPFTVESAPGLVLAGEEDGEGRPVVLLHGLTATRRYVLQGSRLLARSDHRLIAYDARGHGASAAAPGEAYSYGNLVVDLEAVLSDRAVDRCVLAGSSMGAHTAMAFALDHPDRVEALVQITPAYDGSPYLDPAALAGWDARADALDDGDLDRFVTLAGADEVPDRFRDTARVAVRQRIERHRDLHAVAAATRAIPRSAAFDGLDGLRDLDVPVLVVGSRDDTDSQHPLEIAETYARLLPRAELMVEDEGEAPLAWQGSRLSRAIQAFLAAHS